MGFSTTPRTDAGPSATFADWLALVPTLGGVARLLRRRLARQSAIADLNDSELLVLWVVSGCGATGIAQHQLADELELSAGQLSGIVDRLRRAELLAVERDADDRRRQTCRITAAGCAALARLEPQLAAWTDSLAAGFGQPEMAHLRRLLGQLRAALEPAAARLRLAALDAHDPQGGEHA